MIQLNHRDVRPIYEQVKDQLRMLVITGAIKSDEKLPSVRDLAQNLAINPNTIQRAYRELEREGYIYTISGKGSFASVCHEIDKKRTEELLEKFDEVTGELLYLNYSSDALTDRIMRIEEKRRSLKI